MPRYRIYATVTGGKYLGEVEAANEEEAIEKGWESDNAYVSVCHQCSREVNDPEISDITAELGEDEAPEDPVE